MNTINSMNTWIIIMYTCIIIEFEDAIDMKLNEVYGITSRFVTSANDNINTMPNELGVWNCRCEW